MALVTSQHENWLRDFDIQQSQVVQSEKVKRLMTIIDAKDKENVQLKQLAKVNRDLIKKDKRLYEEMQEKHQELKRKCGELYDQVECMKNPYSKESKNAVIDRLKNFNHLYEIAFEK